MSNIKNELPAEVRSWASFTLHLDVADGPQFRVEDFAAIDFDEPSEGGEGGGS